MHSHKFRRIKVGLFDFLNASHHGEEGMRLHEELVNTLLKKEIQNRAAWMIAIACMVHLFLWVFVSSFILHAIMLGAYGTIKELDDRRFSPLWVNIFLNLSAYTNGGFTLSSDSMNQYADKPGAYLWVCVVVLVGNTLAPICLRMYVWCMHKLSQRFPTLLDQEGLAYALEHPRLVAYMMFDRTQTLILFVITISINLLQFFFFLASTLNRPQAEVGAMCLCIYLYVCVCMHVCMFVCVYTCMIHTYIHMCIYIYIYIYTYDCVCVCNVTLL